MFCYHLVILVVCLYEYNMNDVAQVISIQIFVDVFDSWPSIQKVLFSWYLEN